MAGSTGNQLIGRISFDIVDIAKISIGDILVYSAGNIVTYHVDNGITYQEEVDSDETVLHPKTFTTTKEGWEFAGWRLDDVASSDILEDLKMGDEPIILHAVFKQNVTLSYNGNGATGSMDTETSQRYYNNGNIEDATFVVQENKFTYTNRKFTTWVLNSLSGKEYTPGTTISLSADDTLYAVWLGVPYTWSPKPTSQWKKYVLQGTFLNNGPLIQEYGSGINVYGSGTGGGGANPAGGYSCTVDTHGCSKVDITFNASNNWYGALIFGSTTVWYGDKNGNVSSNKQTISISTDKNNQEIKVQVAASSVNTNNASCALTANLYFHN